MKRILMAIILAVLLTGCASKPAPVNGDATGMAAGDSGSALNGKQSASKTLDGKIRFYPTYDAGYKTCTNEIFDFWFDIPKSWRVEDRSEDGSEYTILTDNEKVKISIYGLMRNETENENEYYSSLAGENGSISEISYRDGWVGKQIAVSGTETYYVRVDGDSFLVLHIDAADQSEWLEQNRDILDYVVRSERTAKESYGNDMAGKNSVTVEDLQLGNIKLDMSYDQLLKAIKQKPEKEIKEESEGLEAKTLFFADNTQIYVVDDAVYSINVTSPEYVTPRGLKVGDGRNRLIELYGEPDIKEDDIHWGYNYMGYEVFSVILKDGKVSEMQIDSATDGVEIW